MTLLRYLRARLNERSSWLLIGTAIAAASALPWPWSLASVIVGVIAALVPDGTVKP
jgi:hypothetical protein